MKFLIALPLFFTLIAAHAEEADCNDPTPKEVRTAMSAVKMVEKKSCIKDVNMMRMMLCLSIDQRKEDAKPTKKIKYRSQRLVLEGACVDVEKDSDEVIAQKVSAMWKENQKMLYCNSLTFDVQFGNVIKFAINYLDEPFLESVIAWKVDLNYVDEKDGRTVLDYVRYRYENAHPDGLKPTMDYYYKMLRKAGAKHRSEL